MSPDDPRPDDIDLGEPIGILRSQEDDPVVDFIDRIRRKIHRRTTAAQLASYSWQVPKSVFIEAFGVFGHFVRSFNSPKEPPK